MPSGTPSANFKSPTWSPQTTGQYVCPYCGSVNDTAEGQCPQCTMENTPAGRKATKAKIGPWYVLQKRNPAAPGMKFETLLSFVHRGRVKAHSIVRGPTTHQLWRFASQVRGLSREFGLCYSCGTEIERTATVCSRCNRPQMLPQNPDVFLEADGTGPAVVYREIPPEAAETPPIPAAPIGEGAANTDGPLMSQSPSPAEPSQPMGSPMADAPLIEASIPETPATDTRAAETLAAEAPAAKAPSAETPITEPQSFAMAPFVSIDPPAESSDMVIPSLSEPTPITSSTTSVAPEPASPMPDSPKDSAASPPTDTRGRLENLRRALAQNSSEDELVEPDDAGEGAFDDGPTHPPGRVGPTFVAGGRLPPTPRPRRKWPEMVGFLLILLVTLTSGLLYINPTLINPVKERVNAQLTQWGVLSHPKPPQITQTPQLTATPGTGNASWRSLLDNSSPISPSATDSSNPPAASNHASGSPTQAPASVETSRVEAAPPASVPPPAATSTTPSATPPAASDANPSGGDFDPYERARLLYRSAIDAIGRSDYATAITLLEDIKRLPREAWPGDLDLRLRLARDNLAAQQQPGH